MIIGGIMVACWLDGVGGGGAGGVGADDIVTVTCHSCQISVARLPL